MIGNNLEFQLFKCNNGATLNIYQLDNKGRYQASGCEAKGVKTISLNSDTGNFFKDALKWSTEVVTAVAPAVAAKQEVSTNLADWTVCSTSYQCANQCCSSKYSDGVLKCTPVGGFKTSEGCVGSSSSGLAEWQQCTNSNQCANQCCSGKYSDNVLKCTPVGGFKTSEGCVGSAQRLLRKEIELN
jgi:hypothetical protein